MVADDFDITGGTVDSGQASLDDLLARKYVPTVSVNEGWKTAKDLNGNESDFAGGTGSKGTPLEQLLNALGQYLKATLKPPPENSEFTVDPGSIRSAESTILTNLSSEVEAFETFKKNALAKAQWIFLTDNEHGLDHKEGESGRVFMGMQDNSAPDDLTIKDPNPGLTTAWIYNLELLLKSSGDALQMSGQFAAMLNDAAQYYTQADKAPFRSDD
jgi:hypothetical protein